FLFVGILFVCESAFVLAAKVIGLVICIERTIYLFHTCSVLKLLFIIPLVPTNLLHSFCTLVSIATHGIGIFLAPIYVTVGGPDSVIFLKNIRTHRRISFIPCHF